MPTPARDVKAPRERARRTAEPLTPEQRLALERLGVVVTTPRGRTEAEDPGELHEPAEVFDVYEAEHAWRGGV